MTDSTNADREERMEIYPLKFVDQPGVTLQERVWGGDGLARVLGKTLPAGKPIGESWEIADHAHAVSVVGNGAYRGLGLDALRERFGEQLIGARALAMGRGRLPLLVKFLDCQERLSVQVHPDDAYAAANEGGALGKTEMWYVIAAEPGACLWCGLKPGTDRAALERAITEDRVPDTLAAVRVSAGDCFFIPAGTVHALGGGLIVCEIQQNSDVTYRFYDWGRVGLDGKPRELHVEKSLDAIDYGATASPRCRPQVQNLPGGTIARLAQCPQFITEKLTVAGALAGDTGGTSFHALCAVAGEGAVSAGGQSVPLRRGESAMIPCAAGAYQIEGRGLDVLRAFVP